MQGLILINKPKGITSFDVVRKIKRLTGEKRVGHTGTLDPMATGVLPVLIGRATVLSDYLLNADKKYFAGIKLGITTDTYDVTGEVLSQSEVNVTKAELDSTLASFIGEQKQLPPMFSAIKKNGKKLYELAREGIEVERQPRDICIYSIKRATELVDNAFWIRVSCSKGTYIRSLCNDIGNALGCGAALSHLIREETQGFDIGNAVHLGELTEENIAGHIISEEYAVTKLRRVKVSQKQAIRFSNGGELDIERLKISDLIEGERVRVVYDDLLIGIGEYNTEKNALVISCIVNQYKG